MALPLTHNAGGNTEAQGTFQTCDYVIVQLARVRRPMHSFAFFFSMVQPVAINSQRHRKCWGQHHLEAMHSIRRIKTVEFISDSDRTFGCRQTKLEERKIAVVYNHTERLDGTSST